MKGAKESKHLYYTITKQANYVLTPDKLKPSRKSSWKASWFIALRSENRQKMETKNARKRANRLQEITY